MVLGFLFLPSFPVLRCHPLVLVFLELHCHLWGLVGLALLALPEILYHLGLLWLLQCMRRIVLDDSTFDIRVVLINLSVLVVLCVQECLLAPVGLYLQESLEVHDPLPLLCTP